MKKTQKVIHVPLLLGKLVLLSCLAGIAVADTGYRERVSDSTWSSVINSEDVSAEIQFGRTVTARLLAHYPLLDDVRLTKYVNLVGHAVARNASRQEIDFHFGILDSPSVNAFAVPGGYLFITKGALDLAQDESELAAILAHEIVHVTERHIVKALNIRSSETQTGAGLARLIGGVSDPARVAFSQAADKAVEILLKEGIDKKSELEADRMAVMLTAISGYDGGALARYFSRVKEHKNSDIAISATHPPFDARISALAEMQLTLGLSDIHNPILKERFNEAIGIR